MMDKKIKAIIVDDEPSAITNLSSIVNEYAQNTEIVGTANSIAEAYKLIKEGEPNLVFLDVNIPPNTGFDLLEMFSDREFEVIFVTAYENYAIQAIKERALDYILKPIDYMELIKTLEKCEKNISSKLESNTDKLKIRSSDRIEIFDLNTILYFKADGGYATIYFKDGSNCLVSKGLKAIEEELPNHFLKVHRSYIINCKMVERYKPKDGGHIEMGEHSIPVSDSFKTAVKKLFT